MFDCIVVEVRANFYAENHTDLQERLILDLRDLRVTISDCWPDAIKNLLLFEFLDEILRQKTTMDFAQIFVGV